MVGDFLLLCIIIIGELTIESNLKESIVEFYKALEKVYKIQIPKKVDERLLKCQPLIEQVSCIITFIEYSNTITEKPTKFPLAKKLYFEWVQELENEMNSKD